MMSQYDHNQHSVYMLCYHLIMVVKYRRKVFRNEISDRGREIFEKIAPGYGITLEEWNHDKDHVHVMFRAKPSSEISKFINAYKSASSRLLKKEYPEIREKAVEGRFLESEFPASHVRGRTGGNHPGIHRKAGTECRTRTASASQIRGTRAILAREMQPRTEKVLRTEMGESDEPCDEIPDRAR